MRHILLWQSRSPVDAWIPYTLFAHIAVSMATQASSSSSTSSSSKPLVATGDWTKSLVQLAKTAELKKHALTLQLHTAHILSAHETLDQKTKAIQDLKEQKNKLESERARLLNALREVNEDRDKADILETTMTRECGDLRTKIQSITDGDYSIAKQDVDKLRQELGQPPVPGLQETLEDRKREFLAQQLSNPPQQKSQKRIHAAISTPGVAVEDIDAQTGKRPRGRPKGSKTKKKSATAENGASKEGETVIA